MGTCGHAGCGGVDVYCRVHLECSQCEARMQRAQGVERRGVERDVGKHTQGVESARIVCMWSFWNAKCSV